LTLSLPHSVPLNVFFTVKACFEKAENEFLTASGSLFKNNDSHKIKKIEQSFGRKLVYNRQVRKKALKRIFQNHSDTLQQNHSLK